MRSDVGFVRAAFLLGGIAVGLALCGWAAPAAQASTAKRLGQPISSYSASLFGKQSLSSFELQTLTADPDEPQGGSTSATFDTSKVHVTGFGYGTGYLQANDSPFDSGFGIEIVSAGSPTGFAMIDLANYLETPGAFTPTGYLRCWFKLSAEGPGPTGKLTNQFEWQNNHVGFNSLGSNGPVGVDTHFFDFQRNTLEDTSNVPYTVFADTANNRYALNPANPSPFTLLPTDYITLQDAPDEKYYAGTGAATFESATVAGAVPEPAAAAFGIVACAGALATLRRRR
jgi:hypothetical protein